MNDNISSRVGFYLIDVSIFNKDDWSRMQDFLVAEIIKFELLLRQYLIKIKPSLTAVGDEE